MAFNPEIQFVKEGYMEQKPSLQTRLLRTRYILFPLFILFLFLLPTPLLAQAGPSPWENAVTVLQDSFTGPIARGLALVAIVVGGLMFAFGEGGSKRTLAGIVFGVGMAISAARWGRLGGVRSFFSLSFLFLR